MNQLQPILDQLYTGKSASREQAKQLFSAIVNGEMNQAAMAGMLVAMKMRGETIDEISGAADALLTAAKPFPTPNLATLKQGIVDIVGTGGDGTDTTSDLSLHLTIIRGG